MEYLAVGLTISLIINIIQSINLFEEKRSAEYRGSRAEMWNKEYHIAQGKYWDIVEALNENGYEIKDTPKIQLVKIKKK